MIDLVSPETVIPAVFGAVYGLGRAQDRRRRKTKGGAYKPSPLRPVKRFKSRLRGWHLKPIVTKVTRTDGSSIFASRDADNWIRLFPNPGYRINGKHWCRHTHKHVIEWPVDGEARG